MKYCKHCGKEIEENVAICPNCGCLAKEEASVTSRKSGAASEVGKIMKIGAIVAAVLGLFYAMQQEVGYHDEFNVWSFLGPLLWDLPAIAIVFGVGEIIEQLQGRK